MSKNVKKGNQGPVLYQDVDSNRSYFEIFNDTLEKSGLKILFPGEQESIDAATVAAQIWANPCGEYNKHTGHSTIMVNWDGHGVTEGERWVSLAELLWAGPHGYKMSVYKNIASMYANAEKAGADATLVNISRSKMLDEIVGRQNITLEEIKFVLQFRPQDADLCWRCLTIETDNFTCTISHDYVNYKIANKEIESVPMRKLNISVLRNGINQLKQNLTALDKEEKKLKETCQPLADKAISCADSDKAEVYQKKWRAYLQLVDAEFTDMRSKISEKIECFETKCSEAQKRAKRIGNIKWICFIIFVCTLFVLYIYAKIFSK